MPLQPRGGGVELGLLGAELGHALAQVAAGATALLAVAVPGGRGASGTLHSARILSRDEATRP